MELAKWFFLSKTGLIDANPNLSEEIIDGIWDKLNLAAIIVFLAMISISAGMAVYYYTRYNENPGRHYTPQKWGLLYGIEVLLVIAVSIVVVCVFHPTGDFKKVLNYEIQMIIVNTLYSLVPYLFISWVWCQLGWPTNAYRYIKF